MSWPAPAAWPTSARRRSSLTGGPNGGAGSPSRTWSSGSSAPGGGCRFLSLAAGAGLGCLAGRAIPARRDQPTARLRR